MARLGFLLVALTDANDTFEYFRCDACHASFFQINKRLQDMKALRAPSPLTLSVPAWFSLFEEVCDSEDFSKRSYGVKQYEGKSYLFGPGVPDHLGPDKALLPIPAHRERFSTSDLFWKSAQECPWPAIHHDAEQGEKD